ncbi:MULTISPECIES: DUF6182 family protein [unclassified Streptomyces]|uniref:DUF6182 family protein n=1 Tax=unclassified Streptomyces TaxID=2593676 RepID=UPI000F704B71|nr:MULTISPECIES: DUF6182 family protein [unclassified Streptomyces]AZM60239.1 hypothetical protein DLM49_12355 [Streptomyces sp. WAC 01438]RSM97977.1 hypothetical protein DMA10_09695 [Streptomyces sp. WAC 01420]
MIISQQLLRAENARRIREARPELAARFDLLTEEGLLAAQRDMAAAGAEPKVLAVCVLRDLDLPSWIRETYAFARGVRGEAAAAWRRDFTRTVFLAGNPAQVRERFRFAHIAQDASTAWLGPGPAEESTALRRLLKLFPATAGPPAVPRTAVELPADGPSGDRAPVQRELYLATAGPTAADRLVHLHHLLSEAVLDGVLGPGDRLLLRPVPRLVGIAGPFGALRIVPSPERPQELHALAALGPARLLRQEE